MLTNETRRQLLNRAKAAQFPGSILEVYRAAEQGIDILADHEAQMQQQMQVAQTPQEQQTGLREEHARGNTQASMAFPDVQPGQSFNTVGMKAPINVDKYDNQGHLVESYKNVPPGIQDLPTGPYEGTVIETPAEYQKGGFVTVTNKPTYEQKIKDTTGKLKNLEAKINKSLGFPMANSFNYSVIPEERIREAMVNDGEVRDALRHTAAGYKTSKAIEKKVKNVPYIGGFLDKIGADKLAGFVGSNVLGAGHEAIGYLTSKDWRDPRVIAEEAYEDMYNNFMGTKVALSGNKSEDDDMRKILSLQQQGKLKKGRVYIEDKDYSSKGFQKGGFENLSQTNYEQDLENAYISNFKAQKEQAPKDFKKRLRIPESSGGVNMINPTSTATGFYGQLFSEIKDMPELKGITREEFAADTTLQNQLLDMRWRGDIPGVRGLKDNVKHYREKYSEQTKDFTDNELAALSHFLGRQGGRKYFASIRDNKSFKVPGVNKTPEEYIKEYRKGKKRGGYKSRFL